MNRFACVWKTGMKSDKAVPGIIKECFLKLLTVWKYLQCTERIQCRRERWGQIAQGLRKPNAAVAAKVWFRGQ